MTFELSNAVFSFSTGSKLVIVGNNFPSALCLDVESDKWSEENFVATDCKYKFSCAVKSKVKF